MIWYAGLFAFCKLLLTARAERHNEMRRNRTESQMGLWKNLLITIHNGGDEAVAAVQRMGEDWRAQLEQAAAEVERLREAIRRLADQDATLSVCDGNVTVTMDATLTDEEREAISEAVAAFDQFAGGEGHVAALRGLLERTSV